MECPQSSKSRNFVAYMSNSTKQNQWRQQKNLQVRLPSCAQHKNLSNERRIKRTWLAPNNVKSNQWNWHYQAWPSDDQWHEICKIHNCNFKHHWGFQKFQASSQLNQRFYYEAPCMLAYYSRAVHTGAQRWCSKVLGPHNCPLMRWWQFD